MQSLVSVLQAHNKKPIREVLPARFTAATDFIRPTLVRFVLLRLEKEGEYQYQEATSLQGPTGNALLKLGKYSFFKHSGLADKYKAITSSARDIIYKGEYSDFCYQSVAYHRKDLEGFLWNRKAYPGSLKLSNHHFIVSSGCFNRFYFQLMALIHALLYYRACSLQTYFRLIHLIYHR